MKYFSHTAAGGRSAIVAVVAAAFITISMRDFGHAQSDPPAPQDAQLISPAEPLNDPLPVEKFQLVLKLRSPHALPGEPVGTEMKPRFVEMELEVLVAADTPVFLEMELANGSARTAHIFRKNPCLDFGVLVSDSEGAPIPLTAYGKEYLERARASSQFRTRTLSPNAAPQKASIHLSRLFDLTKAGVYVITGEAEVVEALDRGRTATVAAEPIRFEVVEPNDLRLHERWSEILQELQEKRVLEALERRRAESERD